MRQSPRTYSASHLRRQRDAHARVDGYGRHRHLYLPRIVRDLADTLRRGGRPDLDWLDYGCGKGTFIAELRPLGLFATCEGFDPAVPEFSARPSGRFDLVTCLDVLDVVETSHLDDVLADIATMMRGYALFDCLTKPKGGQLRPHPPFYWSRIVAEHFDIVSTQVEFPGIDGFERALILATRNLESGMSEAVTR